MIEFDFEITDDLLKEKNNLEVILDDWWKKNYMHRLSNWL
jgi:hypothetical protein